MSDVQLDDLLDWNLQLHRPPDDDQTDAGSNIIINHAEEHSEHISDDSDTNIVQASKSMFTILSTPKQKGIHLRLILILNLSISGGKKNKFYSLEMFKFSSKDGSSSGEEDSVPLLEQVNAV